MVKSQSDMVRELYSAIVGSDTQDGLIMRTKHIEDLLPTLLTRVEYLAGIAKSSDKGWRIVGIMVPSLMLLVSVLVAVFK
jgi:hypothetical protein